jgi:hypothetical protein
MKKILLSITLCSLVILSKGQEASVEKSIFGIQTGLIGGWIYNETKLSNLWVLRSEIGVRLTASVGSGKIENTYIFPEGSIEPRFYYNLNKRSRKGKGTAFNSGNYISTRLAYSSSELLYSSFGFKERDQIITLIPTWGMRRNLGKHFNYEIGGGIGISRTTRRNRGSFFDEAYDLQVRIGYQF